MKQSWLIGALAASLILSGFMACGKPPAVCDADYLTKNPQLCPDRAGLGFAQEFNSGTHIIIYPDGGVKPDQDILVLRNGGQSDLTITSAVLSGDPAFTLTTDPEIPATIKGNKYLLARVQFFPRQAKAYTATLTVQSNAENSPSREFAISGCGVPTDGGASSCYPRDAGR